MNPINLSSDSATISDDGETLLLDGETLDIAGVVAIARKGSRAEVKPDEKILARIDASVKWLRDYLAQGYYIYVLTPERMIFTAFKHALLQLTQTGVLTESHTSPQLANYDIGLHSMPVTWVRATMLVRCNHLLRGHSGVRYEIITNLLYLLSKGLTPIVTLQGSVSASGDLMPLLSIQQWMVATINRNGNGRRSGLGFRSFMRLFGMGGCRRVWRVASRNSEL
ncbi:hypothetical protein VTN00DRAFT_5748 [Thermoascus crustaceus]|uniref:uncharacterized protein n=1 Tax=Thermoascus crustaceus TaxID=5088 RepID=UPI00374294B5